MRRPALPFLETESDRSPMSIAPVVPTTEKPLSGRGDVLLISCYELGHQPLNLASPIAHLRAAGFDPFAVDTSVEELRDADLRDSRFIAISVPMHTALRLGARLAKRARMLNPSAHICFYGLYATLNAEFLLREHGDTVISGEYERTLTALVEALARGEDPATVSGVGTRTRPADPVLERLPLLAPERRTLPQLRTYAGLERDGVIVRAGYVETTRGCHHTCGHCPITPIYGGRFFAIPRETVLADARAQVLAGARHITFGDPDFFNGPQHGLRIMRALREEFPSLTFDATIKVEHLIEHRRLVPELASLGCVFVVTAVESLSDVVLRKLSKGHTKTDVDTALAILDASGIPMRPSLLPFTPWTTFEDYFELLSFFAERDLIEHVDPVHFSIRLLVPPGSALLNDQTSTEWVGELEEEAFTYRWQSPDPRLDALQRNVAAIVEQAATKQVPARLTFGRIWDSAYEATGVAPPTIPIPLERRSTPPRLTESWFC
jgi:radical SAM superfamily enzyme YgiQ (UPF0313 family)